MMETPITMDDLGVPLFLKPTISTPLTDGELVVKGWFAILGMAYEREFHLNKCVKQ